MVCAEALENNRCDLNKQYWNAQWDETAFGKRKYHRGARRRKTGVQWALTCVSVHPDTNKTLAVDLQFLALNKRGAEQIVPLVVQRMQEGGTMTTDSWRAYPAAAVAAGVTHRVVNHAKEFKSAEGDHTNNVEGIHGVIKQDARQQFGRLPYLNSEGNTYYLDLLVWRANKRLANVPFFYGFALDLWTWTRYPLHDFLHLVPMDNELEDDDDDDDDDAEAVDVEHDDHEWFLLPEDVDSDDPDYVE